MQVTKLKNSNLLNYSAGRNLSIEIWRNKSKRLSWRNVRLKVKENLLGTFSGKFGLLWPQCQAEIRNLWFWFLSVQFESADWDRDLTSRTSSSGGKWVRLPNYPTLYSFPGKTGISSVWCQAEEKTKKTYTGKRSKLRKILMETIMEESQAVLPQRSRLEHLENS